MDITIIIAIYGAVVATAVAIWDITKDIKDKPKLIPKYSTGFLTFKGVPNITKPIFSIQITNPTRHKMKLEAVEIYFRNGQKFIFMEPTDFLPKEISPRDSYTVYRSIEIIKDLIDDNGDPTKILVRDATGKNYSGSIKNMIGNVSILFNSTRNTTP